MYGHQSVGMLPDDYPQFFSRAKGARLWDADGNEMLDFMCAYGPNLFGYGDAEIDAAYIRQLGIGDALTGPTHLMVELAAEQMTGMVKHADWAMFCKNGTDATSMVPWSPPGPTLRRKTIAHGQGRLPRRLPLVRAARHGREPGGQGPSDLLQLQRHRQPGRGGGQGRRRSGGRVRRADQARRLHRPGPGPIRPTLRRARELCDQTGALLVVDDVRAGLRLARDCSWSLVGVEPDLSCWGKCLANGHPLSAFLGSNKARKAASQVFVTGSFWFQAAPMAAALVTLARVRNSDYLEKDRGSGPAPARWPGAAGFGGGLQPAPDRSG